MDLSQNRTQVAAHFRRCFLRSAAGPLLCTLPLVMVLAGVSRPAFAGDLAGPRFAASETDGLNLTPTQQKKLATLETASRTQAHQLIGQIEKLRHTLSEAYEAYLLDVTAVRRANQDLNRVQGQLLDLRLSEQLQLRRILSSDQFTQLQAALHKRGADDDRHRDPDERHGPHPRDKDAP